MLTDDQLLALVFVSVILGGATWNNLPTMLRDLETERLYKCLNLLCSFLGKNFGVAISAWICSNWADMEPQTLLFIKYLNDYSSAIAFDILTISGVVDINREFSDLVILTKVFAQCSHFKLLFDNIESTAMRK